MTYHSIANLSSILKKIAVASWHHGTKLKSEENEIAIITENGIEVWTRECMREDI